jgi:hypothetical protein
MDGWMDGRKDDGRWKAMEIPDKHSRVLPPV